MNKEEFVQLIKEYQQHTERIDELEKALDGLDLYGSGLFDFGIKMFDKVLDLSFSQDVVEVISWWMFETNFGKDPNMWIEDMNKQKRYIRNINELWDYISEIK